jgi:predicted permease
MDTLLQDLRYAVRSLRRTPGFTFTVIAVMALGIGVNSLIYTVVRGILFADLRIPEPERIVRIEAVNRSRPRELMNLSLPDLCDVISQARSLRGTFGVIAWSPVVSTGDEAQKRSGAIVSAGLPEALGVRPRLGRWFTPAECTEGANFGPLVLGDRAWREQFAADPNVLGRAVRISGGVRTVIGVMPEGFRFPETADYFVPLAMNDSLNTRGRHFLTTYARLAPGATLRQAQAELTTLARDLAQDHRETNDNLTLQATRYRESLARDVRPVMSLLALAVTFVLLIACANVANLLLARAARRRREIGVRIALGASRHRLVRQMLTESLLLSCSGGVIGILLGAWGMRVTLASIPVPLPFWMKFDLDPGVVLVVAGVAVLAGCAFGIAPALQLTSGDVLEPLREGTPGGGDSPSRRRMRNSLVVAEIALAVMLLIGSGLMVRSFLHQQDQRSELRTGGVLTGTVTLPPSLYPGDTARDVFEDQFRSALLALPGVRAAGGVLNLHLGSQRATMSLQREGLDSEHSSDAQNPVVSFNVITPGYLDAVGMPLRRGRDLVAGDTRDAVHVSLVNDVAARQLWPGQDAIGKRWRFGPDDARGWYTVVGVTASVPQRLGGGEDHVAEILIPATQIKAQTLTWAVRSDSPPAALVAAVRRTLRDRDANLAFADASTLREHVSRSGWQSRMYAQLMGVFSFVALVIAALGIYGVMAYSVAQRTREIGIRMALGAARADVQRMVVGQALRLTLLGTGLGLALAFALTRFMHGILFGIRPDDPPTFLGVTLILVLSSAAAAWLPTARAVRVDPVVALRHE